MFVLLLLWFFKSLFLSFVFLLLSILLSNETNWTLYLSFFLFFLIYGMSGMTIILYYIYYYFMSIFHVCSSIL